MWLEAGLDVLWEHEIPSWSSFSSCLQPNPRWQLLPEQPHHSKPHFQPAKGRELNVLFFHGCNSRINIHTSSNLFFFPSSFPFQPLKHAIFVFPAAKPSSWNVKLLKKSNTMIPRSAGSGARRGQTLLWGWRSRGGCHGDKDEFSLLSQPVSCCPDALVEKHPPSGVDFDGGNYSNLSDPSPQTGLLRGLMR